MKKRMFSLISLLLAAMLLLCACGNSSAPTDSGAESEDAPAQPAAGNEGVLGEWISTGNTDDVLVLNADGTCTVNGQPLNWTTETTDRGFFRIEEEWGGFVYYFRLNGDISNPEAIYLAGLIPNEEGRFFSKRSTSREFLRRDAIEAQNIGGGYEELDAFMQGEWILVSDRESEIDSITFHDDMTVSIDDQSYTYAYPEWMRDEYESGIPDNWSVALFDDDGTQVGSVSFNQDRRYENGPVFYYAYLNYQDNNYSNYYRAEKIEITLDNWQDYFDLEERVTASTNAFDEVTSITWVRYLVLKEEYRDRYIYTQMAMEYTVADKAAKYITYNSASQEYTIESVEAPAGMNLNAEPYTSSMEIWDVIRGCSIDYAYGNNTFQSEGEISSATVAAYTTFTMDRITGDLFLNLAD